MQVLVEDLSFLQSGNLCALLCFSLDVCLSMSPRLSC